MALFSRAVIQGWSFFITLTVNWLVIKARTRGISLSYWLDWGLQGMSVMIWTGLYKGRFLCFIIFRTPS